MERVSRRGFLQGVVAAGAVTVFGDVGDAAPAVRFGYITDCHYAAHITPSLLRNYHDGLLKMDAFGWSVIAGILMSTFVGSRCFVVAIFHSPLT